MSNKDKTEAIKSELNRILLGENITINSLIKKYNTKRNVVHRIFTEWQTELNNNITIEPQIEMEPTGILGNKREPYYEDELMYGTKPVYVYNDVKKELRDNVYTPQ